MQLKLAQDSANQLELLKQLLDLQQDMIVMLLSMLEGRCVIDVCNFLFGNILRSAHIYCVYIYGSGPEIYLDTGTLGLRTVRKAQFLYSSG